MPTGAVDGDGGPLLVAPATANPPVPKNEAGKLIVGSVKNGYGMHTADVLLQADAVDAIVDALAAELEAAGYSVDRDAVGAEAPEGTPAVRLTVTRLVVDQIPGAFTVTASAAVGLQVAVEQDGETVELFQVDGGQQDDAMVSDASSKQAALDAALKDAIGKAVPLIVAAIDALDR